MLRVKKLQLTFILCNYLLCIFSIFLLSTVFFGTNMIQTNFCFFRVSEQNYKITKRNKIRIRHQLSLPTHVVVDLWFILKNETSKISFFVFLSFAVQEGPSFFIFKCRLTKLSRHEFSFLFNLAFTSDSK